MDREIPQEKLGEGPEQRVEEGGEAIGETLTTRRGEERGGFRGSLGCRAQSSLLGCRPCVEGRVRASREGGLPGWGNRPVPLAVIPVKETGDRPSSGYIRGPPVFAARDPAMLPLPPSATRLLCQTFRSPSGCHTLLLPPISQAVSHLPLLCGFPSLKPARHPHINQDSAHVPPPPGSLP